MDSEEFLSSTKQITELFSTESSELSTLAIKQNANKASKNESSIH